MPCIFSLPYGYLFRFPAEHNFPGHGITSRRLVQVDGESSVALYAVAACCPAQAADVAVQAPEYRMCYVTSPLLICRLMYLGLEAGLPP